MFFHANNDLLLIIYNTDSSDPVFENSMINRVTKL
jgi:hypothetical protein